MNYQLLKFLLVFSIVQSIAKGQKFSRRRKPTNACENSGSGTLYLRDREKNSQQCYPAGSQGPCGEMMIFYQNPSPRLGNYGFCDCDQGYRSDLPCKDTPIRKRIFIPSEGRCYSVFSQGPCTQGRWLVYDEKQQSPSCVPNPCTSQKLSPPTSNHFWFYDPERRQCFKTLTQGYCPSGYTLELSHDSQYPSCQKKSCFSSLVLGIRSALECQFGSRFSFLTRSCTFGFRNFNGLG